MSSDHHADASQGSLDPHDGPHCPVYSTYPAQTEPLIATVHVETFQQRPATAADALREVLNMRQGDMLASFLSATPRGDTLTMDEFEVLRESGFVLALADTLIELIEWCSSSRRRDTDEDLLFDESFQEYIIALSLAHFVTYTTSDLCLKRDMKTKLLCDRLTQVCKQIWLHKDTFFNVNIMRSASEYLEQASHIIRNFESIYKFYYNGAEPPFSTFFPHVAMYCWFNCAHLDVRTWKLAGMVGCSIMASPQSEWRPFLEEVILASIGHRTPADAYWTMLSIPDLEQIGLSNHIEVIRTCIYDGPPLGDLSGNRSILKALAKATQRHFCTEYVSVGMEVPMGRVTMAFVGMLNERYPDNTTREIICNLGDLHFLPAIANTLASSVEALDRDSTPPLDIHIRMLTIYGQQYRDNVRRSDNVPHDQHTTYSYVRHVLRLYWIPGLDDLRAALSRQRRRQGANPTVRRELENFKQLWLDCGHACDLEQRTERRIDSATEDLTSAAFERWRDCFYEKCVCYGRKPLHGSRRVCKGCWRTYYCGKMCQRKDWSAGHKNVCVGRRERSTQ